MLLGRVKVAGKRIGFGQIGKDACKGFRSELPTKSERAKTRLKKVGELINSRKLDKAFDACPSDSDEDDEDDYDN